MLTTMNIDELTTGDRTLFQKRTGIIDLGIGAPDAPLLEHARKALLAAANHHLSDPDHAVFVQYGPRAGDPVFRDALAKLLTSRLPGPAAAEDLFTTAGATSGLALAASCFFDTGAPVLIEDPTYFLARTVLKQAGMRLVPVAQDDDGINPARLAAAAQALPPAPAGRRFRAMLYLIPTFNNPTGRVLPDRRRRDIIDIARKNNLLVVCDDVYDLLSFNDEPRPRRIVSMKGSEGWVLSNGSFSKILGPGMRCGWIESRGDLPEKLAQSAYARSGGGMNHFTTGILLSLIQSGAQARLLDRLRDTYRQRCNALCDALEESMPSAATFHRPDGGFFVWVTLPEGTDTLAALDACQTQAGVRYQPGAWFGDAHSSLRLSFAHNHTADLQKGAHQLARFWTSQL
jgi:DNA-binding transcriptional MocR family regulator